MERIKQVTREAYELAQEDGWGEFECCHGYGLFSGEYPTIRGMIDADHVERIDIMNAWAGDTLAARDAEKRGYCRIIRDVRGLYPVFIDTPENRRRVLEQWEALK